MAEPISEYEHKMLFIPISGVSEFVATRNRKMQELCDLQDQAWEIVSELAIVAPGHGQNSGFFPTGRIVYRLRRLRSSIDTGLIPEHKFSGLDVS